MCTVPVPTPLSWLEGELCTLPFSELMGCYPSGLDALLVEIDPCSGLGYLG